MSVEWLQSHQLTFVIINKSIWRLILRSHVDVMVNRRKWQQSDNKIAFIRYIIVYLLTQENIQIISIQLIWKKMKKICFVKKGLWANCKGFTVVIFPCKQNGKLQKLNQIDVHEVWIKFTAKVYMHFKTLRSSFTIKQLYLYVFAP